ncbi:GAF and ANTAR domain-containing protein [Nitriliruptor alkaliphilus]|uniref:GAF and ANTAR domain-containing protein n=1 Tax=Nitriliruptor alkaliphilus TaxID=427918 RepID=UPI000697B5DC|nr:GAF and ANTAR domain-containing protein [Nitriliruptor alkaliphilus]
MTDAPDAEGVSSDAYLRTIEELLALLLEDTPFGELLEQVLELTERAAERVDGVAVTVRRWNGRTDTAAASSDAAREIDEVQRERGAGPCVDTMDSGREYASDDLRHDRRWGAAMAETADRTGLVAVLAVPLVAGGETIGAINVFSRTPGGIDAEAATTVRGIAAPVAATLANARAYHRVEQLGEQLREALSTRGVIEQAKGILMVRAGVDDEQAFALLRRTSQHQNRKLRDVAASVVAMRDQLPSARDPRGGSTGEQP